MLFSSLILTGTGIGYFSPLSFTQNSPYFTHLLLAGILYIGPCNQAAHAWYMNLDKLIQHVNQLQANGSNVNLFYSTPSCYLKSLQESGLTWPTKTDDFFPYASDPHAYWSGYFTSRPTSKRFIREAELYAKQLSQLTVLRQDARSTVELLGLLRETVGIVQHHDAITGTEKQHVAHDYHTRIYGGLAQGFGALNIGLEGLPLSAGTIMCERLNISQCNAATEALASGAAVRITVYNPLGWTRARHTGRVPVIAGDYVVEDEAGELLPSMLMPLPDWVASLPGRQSNASHELVFSTGELPPLGTVSFVIKKVDKINKINMMTGRKTGRKQKKNKSPAKKLSMDTLSSHIKVDPTSGDLYILDKASGRGGNVTVKQCWPIRSILTGSGSGL
jgi:Alpha mannosidase middle domain/Glycosyl hydrolases family 38 N-terminal domain